MVHVRGFVLGRYPIRGYLAWGDSEREALFVDPGGWDEVVMQFLEQERLRVGAIVLTHGHWDHIEGIAEARTRLNAPVYAHRDDVHLLPEPPDVAVAGDEAITCGDRAWRILHVPGHTAGSVAYATSAVVFTGDALFAGAIGGTSTQEAYLLERQSIRERLFPLGDDVRVFPAHGPATTIGVERRCNPFLR